MSPWTVFSPSPMGKRLSFFERRLFADLTLRSLCALRLILIPGDLGPGIPQRSGAVEEQPFGRGIHGVHRKIA